MNIFRKFFAFLRLREAVKIAEKEHLKTGRRYYVMPQHGSAGKKLVVMDRQNFRRLKMKHYISRDARVFDLVRECFYCTGYSNGDQYLDAIGRKRKAMQYFEWVDADRKITKARRRNGKV